MCRLLYHQCISHSMWPRIIIFTSSAEVDWLKCLISWWRGSQLDWRHDEDTLVMSPVHLWEHLLLFLCVCVCVCARSGLAVHTPYLIFTCMFCCATAMHQNTCILSYSYFSGQRTWTLKSACMSSSLWLTSTSRWTSHSTSRELKSIFSWSSTDLK